MDYLGFTHSWGRSRNGLVRVKRKTSKKRLRRALRDLTQWLRQERHARKLPDLWQAIARKMRGHFNDFGVTDNSRSYTCLNYKSTNSCSNGSIIAANGAVLRGKVSGAMPRDIPSHVPGL